MGKIFRVGVLASGRGSNLQALINKVHRKKFKHIDGSIVEIQIPIVISNKKEAYALERARRAGIEAMWIDPQGYIKREDYDLKVASVLKKRKTNLVVLAGYMRIVTPAFLREFPDAVINIHPALLPSFPGLRGQRQAIEYGVKVSGCTVHFVDEGVDTGPPIIQIPVQVKNHDNEDSLALRILKHEHRALPKAVILIATGRVKKEGRKVSVMDSPLKALLRDIASSLWL